MLVRELLHKQDLVQLEEVYNRLFHDDDNQKAPTEFFQRVLNELDSAEAAEPELEIHIHKGEGFISVDGLADDGTFYAIDLMPWGEWRNSQVTVGDGLELTEAEQAAYVIFEMTFIGFPEDQDELRNKLDAAMAEVREDFMEIAPGIKVSPQVAAMMDKDGEIHKMVTGLDVEKMKTEGRRIK